MCDWKGNRKALGRWVIPLLPGVRVGLLFLWLWEMPFLTVTWVWLFLLFSRLRVNSGFKFASSFKRSCLSIGIDCQCFSPRPEATGTKKHLLCFFNAEKCRLIEEFSYASFHWLIVKKKQFEGRKFRHEKAMRAFPRSRRPCRPWNSALRTCRSKHVLFTQLSTRLVSHFFSASLLNYDLGKQISEGRENSWYGG